MGRRTGNRGLTWLPSCAAFTSILSIPLVSAAANNASLSTSSSSTPTKPGSVDTTPFVTSGRYTFFETFTVSAGVTTTEELLDYPDPSITVLTGPTTLTATRYYSLTIATANASTSSSYQDWDPDPYISAFVGGTERLDPTFLSSLNSFVSYGRMPACTSAFLAYNASHPLTTGTDFLIETSTLANGQITSSISVEPYTDPTGELQGYCCQYCSIFFQDVQVFYFPGDHPNTNCAGNGTANRSPQTVSIGARDISMQAEGQLRRRQGVYATDPDSGYIYTSPSVYVKFPAVAASDSCGQLGSAVNNLTLAFAPGELSTVVGRNPGHMGYGTALPFDPNDLPCGPNNGSMQFNPEESMTVTGYLPIIAVPQKLLDVQPSWSTCVGDVWQGLDPPFALQPVAGVDPGPTSVSSPAPDSTPAVPADPGVSAQPKQTGPGNPASTAMFQPGPAKPSPSADPATNGPPAINNDPPANNNDPPANNNDPPASNNDPPAGNNDPPTNNHNAPASNNDPPANNNNPPATPADPGAPLNADPGTNAPAKPANVDPGTNAPAPVPAPAADPGVSNPAQPVQPAQPINVGGQIVAPAPGSSNAVIIGGQTVNQGQGPTTINGAAISVAGGSVFVNGQGAPVPTPAPAPQHQVPAPVIGGQTASIVNPSAVVIGSQTANLGGPAITVGGTPVSLAPGGLVAGGQGGGGGGVTIPLGAPTAIAGETPIPLGTTAVVIGSQTVSEGAPAVTIGGTPVSLGSAGLVLNPATTFAIGPGSGSGSGSGSGPGQQGQPPSATIDILTIGSETLAVNPTANDIVVGSQTLTPGSPGITVNGQLISLGTNVLVVGSETETLSPGATASGLGWAIISGVGGVGGGIESVSTSAPNTATAAVGGGGNTTGFGDVFEGGAASMGREGMGGKLGLCFAFVGLVLGWVVLL